MDKGWGLTLDSDSIGFFVNKPSPAAAAVKLDHNSKRNPFAASRMFSSAEFHVKLGCRDDTDYNANRLAVNEVDFFSDKHTCALASSVLAAHQSLFAAAAVSSVPEDQALSAASSSPP